MDTLKEKQEKTSKDLRDIDEAFASIAKARTELQGLERRIVEFHVFGEDLNKTEKELKKLRSEVEGAIKSAKDLVGIVRNQYISSQQIVPSDVAQDLTALELLAESLSNKMEEKDREFKKARTVRTDYNADVAEVQNWIKEAELKVQDRSVEPQVLNEHLQQIQQEIGGVTDRLEKLTRNGKVIIEKTQDDEEKRLVQSTIDNLTEQLSQVKSWLEEKKQQVCDTLDAWQRFLSLYQAVLNWVQEKKLFLKDPLQLSTLQEARQKLHDYSVSNSIIPLQNIDIFIQESLMIGFYIYTPIFDLFLIKHLNGVVFGNHNTASSMKNMVLPSMDQCWNCIY